MNVDLGTKIRQLRHRDGRTQEVLAEALGVTSQAVSRWESGGSFPDMNLIPPIANYFGISIDELFGYTNQREIRIEEMVRKIQERKWKQDVDDTIAFARNALLEFPGNEKLMVCLASVLYTAGYTRHGEHHLTDGEGYDVYDTARHCTYSEWKEAVSLYEKALPTMEDGELRRVAVGELTQLYVNMGQHEKALALADAAPGIYNTREYLRICACDGKERAQAQGNAVMAMLHASAALMIQGVLTAKENMTPGEKVRSINSAIGLFGAVCWDGNYGAHNRLTARMYTLQSLYLWLDGNRDGAFDALDKALAHFRQFEALCRMEEPRYSVPLLNQVPVDLSRCPVVDPAMPETTAASLHMAWPWWHVEEEETVKAEIQKDPRWAAWVGRCNEGL